MLEIHTATTGPAFDPDGYEVGIDGAAGRPIGATDTLLVGELAAGEHVVALTGLATGCSLEGENPQNVDIVPGSTGTVEFAITCEAAVGRLEVTTATTGPDPDADGYEVLVDGASASDIGFAATVSLDALSAGTHTVALAGLTPNCGVNGENQVFVDITPGETATARFDVACTRAPGLLIAWSQYQPDQGWDVLTMRPDGSGVVNLTHAPGDDETPIWSPDGSKIAFVSHPMWEPPADIVVMNADGTARTVLANEPTNSVELAWSPGGSKLAYAINGCACDVRVAQFRIYTINPDGTGRTLVAVGASPAWSPDGAHIAFETVEEYGFPLRGSIHVVAADGSDERSLSTPPAGFGDHHPQWSPDGARLAFVRSGDEDVDGRVLENLWAMGADGTNPRQLTEFVKGSPRGSVPGFDWSPDGATLAYACAVSPWQIDLCLVHPDGTGPQRITGRYLVLASDPRWSSDGARILFTQRMVSEYDDNATTLPDLALLDVASRGVVVLKSRLEDVSGRWRP